MSTDAGRRPDAGAHVDIDELADDAEGLLPPGSARRSCGALGRMRALSF
ncbi:hypothetical protein [Microlunatus sp. Gsoil 973]|nr:hypothetical protein [Microlunatus sp. Gsoil 973]QGN34549.1 hypothetical protein GJV80_18910 [Microlunatus sp. Gsoil 973]